MAEPSIEKKPPASAPLLKEAQLTSVKTEPPVSPSAADISQIAVETSSAVKIVEPDKPADVIRIAEELSSATEDLDAGGLLTTENEQQTQISDTATSSASADLPHP